MGMRRVEVALKKVRWTRETYIDLDCISGCYCYVIVV